MGSSARRLATLVPALLCALWSLLAVPPPAAAPQDVRAEAAVGQTDVRDAVRGADPVPHAPTPAGVGHPALPSASDSRPGSGPGGVPPHAGPHAVPRATSQEPHLAAAAVVSLPAAVENPVRFPAAPAAPAA
ncbi:hypothetical protein ACWEP1_38845, partial [Streptomyces sp. NPDC004285]